MSNTNKPNLLKSDNQINEYEQGINDLENINNLVNKIEKNKKDEETSFKDILKSIIISHSIVETKKYCKKCEEELVHLDDKKNINVTNDVIDNKEINKEFKIENIINSFIIHNELSERDKYCKKCCEELFGTKEEHKIKINKIIESKQNKYNYKEKNLEI